MDLTFSEEQRALRELTRDFLAKHASSAAVRAAAGEPGGFDRQVWQRLTTELGLTALAAPESLGGAGATLFEVALVAEETGAALLPSPLLSTSLSAAVLAELAGVSEAGAEFAREVVPGLADGSLVSALACSEIASGRSSDARLHSSASTAQHVSGVAEHVVDGGTADIFLVAAEGPAGPALCGVRANDPGVTVVDCPAVDQTRRQARVTFTDTPAIVLTPAETSSQAVDRVVELLRVLLAMESAGAARRCLETTVDYLKQRTQFGRLLGSFQALKHRCADLAVEVESAVSTAYYAAWAAVQSPGELPVVAPLAKAHCADVFFHVAAESIQLHGGVGFTWEHDAHLYLKRAKSTQLLYGSPSQLRRLVGHRAGIC